MTQLDGRYRNIDIRTCIKRFSDWIVLINMDIIDNMEAKETKEKTGKVGKGVA